jgi:hypothetical protein
MKKEKEHGTWVPEHIDAMTNINAIDKLVLSSIRFLNTLEEGCFISNDALAKKHGVGYGVVKRSLITLRRCGYIENVETSEKTRKIIYLLKDPPSAYSAKIPNEPIVKDYQEDKKQELSIGENINRPCSNLANETTNKQSIIPKDNELSCPEIARGVGQNWQDPLSNNGKGGWPELHRPIIEKNYKRIKEEREKSATVVAPVSQSIENLEDQNPKTQNEDQKTKPIEQPPSPTQPLLIDINANQNAINTNQPNNQFCIVADPADGKKPKAVRAKGGTNEITADVFFDMLPAIQRQAAIKVLLGEFIDSRRASKKPVTINAAKQIIRDFHRYNDIVLGVALQRSIKNGWRGLFLPDQANFVNDSSADIKSYRDLVDECRLNEDPEEKRARLLKAKEQEMRENEEEHKRFLQRQQTEKIAKEIEEAPISRPVTSTEHGNGDTSYYQYSQGKQETTSTPATPQPQPQPQQPPSTGNERQQPPRGPSLRQEIWDENIAYERKLEEERRIQAIKRQERLVILNAKIAEMKAAEAASLLQAAEKESHVS